ncbi:MAG: hypothetical protein AAF393_04060 [Pseudomonadota bacterium]
MLRFVFVLLAAALITPGAALAKTPFGIFDSLEEMEQVVGGHLMALRFNEALKAVDPTSQGMSAQDRSSFVNSYTNYYKNPMTSSALLREDTLGGGFRRALYSYWGDTIPIYFYVVTQERDGKIWILQWNMSDVFSSMIERF